MRRVTTESDMEQMESQWKKIKRSLQKKQKRKKVVGTMRKERRGEEKMMRIEQF